MTYCLTTQKDNVFSDGVCNNATGGQVLERKKRLTEQNTKKYKYTNTYAHTHARREEEKNCLMLHDKT